MATPTLRRANREDLAGIIALLADDALGRDREDLSTPVAQAYIDAFEALDGNPDQLLMVADDDGRLAGCFQLTLIPGLSRRGMWRGQIEGVRVASSHRGEGLGRQMVAWAIAECRRRGCGLVQLTSDKTRRDAHRFYESLGFEASHEGMKLKL
ncbi:MAG: GNAT family N-acetyltransferase [Alphaproteobacteria bacterium]|nr:GNAT family N-acetyltransferase [Alphaproteobacteria bacterium]